MIRFFNGRTLTMADGVSVTTDEVWTDGDRLPTSAPRRRRCPRLSGRSISAAISLCRALRTRTRTPA